MSEDKKALEIIARNDQLKAARSVFESIWQELAYVIQPRKDNIQQQSSPNADLNAWLFDTTAIDANLTLSAGQLQYITPSSERWFSYQYPAQLAARQPDGEIPDDAAQWFAQCTEIAIRELAGSNFYTEVHEMYLDRGGFGTAALYVQEGKRAALNFHCPRVGSYCIAEDDEGFVDTVFREFQMTARQMVQKFGEKEVGEKVLKAYKEPRTMETKFTVIHAVYPRAEDQREYGKRDGRNKAIASCYVCREDQKVIRESGYDETPYSVTRYLTWNEEVYGYCPAIDVLPTIRQVNFIEKQMDALAEKTAYPPVLIPESMENAVDLRAAGVTLFDPNNPNAMPKEWATMGRYDIGLQRTQMKQEAIKKAFHNDLFQMFAGLDRDITAYQAMQMASEKLVMFSPTFTRLTTEFCTPCTQSIFAILYRGGYFPDAPASVFAPNQRGEMELVLPQVAYTSKVALAIKALENRSIMELISILGPILSVSPDAIDNVEVDKLVRTLMRNQSMPTQVIRPMEEVLAKRDARAQQMAAQQAIASAQGVAAAAKDLGSAPPQIQEAAGAAIDI